MSERLEGIWESFYTLFAMALLITVLAFLVIFLTAILLHAFGVMDLRLPTDGEIKRMRQE